MQTVQAILRVNSDIQRALSPLSALEPDLLLVFGPSERLVELAPLLAVFFPDACRVGCSTALAICTEGVEEAGCVITAVRFDTSGIVDVSQRLVGKESSFETGRRLGEALPANNLRLVLLLGQGVGVRGSALVDGVNSVLGGRVPVLGGLASRAEGYYQTSVLDASGCRGETVVALGLYGEKLRFGFGVLGGWSPFGPARKVTRCEGNVLYELDGEPALEVYRRYLGDYARDLPGIGHFFPFAMLDKNHDEIGLIRSLLAVDEKTGGLKFAGEIEPDGYLRMMHANTDKLVGGAEAAAEAAKRMLPCNGAYRGLVFMVSCVGRDYVMGERVEEEVDSVAAAFGKDAVVTGFYSFGEISPPGPGLSSKLHNQTVMVAYLDEWPEDGLVTVPPFSHA